MKKEEKIKQKRDGSGMGHTTKMNVGNVNKY